MNRRDIVIGAIALLVLVGGYFYVSRNRTPDENLQVTNDDLQTVEKNIEDSFKIDIPDDANKAVLGSSTEAGTGIVTWDVDDNGQFTATILADLPDLETGTYTAYAIKGQPTDESYDEISLGGLRVAKGGYLLEVNESKDLTGYDIVVRNGDKELLRTTIK